ncbi:MAG: glycoside hydrolase family 130 protein [Armatimonadota bacterium]
MKINDVLNGKWIVDNRVVLSHGAPGDWDDLAVYTPQVIEEDGMYRMYYTGRDRQMEWRIGTATSEDLLNWTKHPEPVLSSGSDWDKQIDFPWPVKVNDRYYIYYEAKRILGTPYPDDPIYGRWAGMTLLHMYSRSTGLAVSDDGIHFVKHPRPVLTADLQGTWDHNGICASRVFPYRDEYVMFYAGSDTKRARTGLAFSKDLINWTRYDKNPILSTGDIGEWDSLTVLFGSVLKLEDGYIAAYEGESGEYMQIGLAYSSDLFNWTKFDGNPIIRTEKPYREHGTFVCAPHLVMKSGELYLLYTHNLHFDGEGSQIEIAKLED